MIAIWPIIVFSSSGWVLGELPVLHRYSPTNGLHILKAEVFVTPSLAGFEILPSETVFSGRRLELWLETKSFSFAFFFFCQVLPLLGSHTWFLSFRKKFRALSVFIEGLSQVLCCHCSSYGRNWRPGFPSFLKSDCPCGFLEVLFICPRWRGTYIPPLGKMGGLPSHGSCYKRGIWKL